jgi:capsule biosynthesis phosphatase
MKNIIIDLDGTLTIESDLPYAEKIPNIAVLNQLKNYKRKGFKITILTSRGMRTYDGNVGKINAYTIPVILKWLNEHNVPFDEVFVGKAWCGFEGFYVDDKAIRPDEFLKLSYEEIRSLVGIDP